MTNATDRRQIVELVNEARMAGARLQRICQELGIGLNTYRRWSTGENFRGRVTDIPTSLTMSPPMPARWKNTRPCCHGIWTWKLWHWKQLMHNSMPSVNLTLLT